MPLPGFKLAFGFVRWILRGVIVLLAVGGWLLAAAAVHVVILPVATASEADVADDWRLVVLPKQRLSFYDTYIDARAWTPADAEEHADLLARVAKSGQVDVMLAAF
jgi:hypothetical protein